MAEIHVAVAMFDTKRRILLVRQAYDQRLWSLPGGRVEHDETPLEAAIREVREETNLQIKPVAFIGTYAAPERDMISLLFEGAIDDCKDWCWHRNQEIEDIGFFSFDMLPSPLSKRMTHRITDAFHVRRGVYREGDIVMPDVSQVSST